MLFENTTSASIEWRRHKCVWGGGGEGEYKGVTLPSLSLGAVGASRKKIL